MTTTWPIILLALSPTGAAQPSAIQATPPKEMGPTLQATPAAPVAPMEAGLVVVPPPMPPPHPQVPAVYPDPAPPLRTGAWWYGAMIPIPHQRDLYYPTWDTPVLACKGVQPFGAPALDIPQSVIPIYWIRNGQGAVPPRVEPLPATPPGPAVPVAVPTASGGTPPPPTTP
jgi:hypothetical protein